MTLYFTPTHERIHIDADIATVGITRHAVNQLGDVVFVEHLETEGDVSVNQPISVVESTKAASEVYAPFAGVIADVNQVLEETPELVSDDQSETVWFFKIRITADTDLSHLLDKDAYMALIG